MSQGTSNNNHRESKPIVWIILVVGGIAIICTTILVVVLAHYLIKKSEQGVGNNDSNIELVAQEEIDFENGGIVDLDNHAKLIFPGESIQGESIVTFRKISEGIPDASTKLPILSTVYEIDLGGGELISNYTLVLPIPSEMVTDGITEQEIFIMYFDEEISDWVYRGGKTDFNSMTITIDLDHTSLFGIGKWDWDQWTATLTMLLSGSLTEMNDALLLQQHQCSQGDDLAIWVDETNAYNVLNGCVESNDGHTYNFSIVNPRTVTVDVEVLEGGPGNLAPMRMFRGQIKKFSVGNFDSSPLRVRAQVNRTTMAIDVLRAFYMTLPGMSLAVGNSDIELAQCIAVAIDQALPTLGIAYETLIENDYNAGTEESIKAISQFLFKAVRDEKFLSQVIVQSQKCSTNVAVSYPLEKIVAGASEVLTIGQLTASLMTLEEVVLGRWEGQLAFNWPKEPELVEDNTDWYAFSDKNNNLAIAHLDGSDYHILVEVGRTLGFRYSSFSPNGQYLATQVVRCGWDDPCYDSLLIIDMETEDSWEILSGQLGNLKSYSWMPNSQEIIHSVPYTFTTYSPPGFLDMYYEYIDADGLYITNILTEDTKLVVPAIDGRPLTSAVVDPLGESVIFTQEPDLIGGDPDVFMVSFDAPENLIHLPGVGIVSWSPDGSKVAVSPGSFRSIFSEAQSLILYNKDGKLIQEYSPIGKTEDHTMNWSPDGRKIYILTGQLIDRNSYLLSEILFLDTDERKEIWPFPISGFDKSFQCWLPDGNNLVFYDNDMEEYRIKNVYTGEEIPVFSGIQIVNDLACPGR